LLASLFTHLAACGEESPPEVAAGPYSQAPVLAPFELRDVLQTALAELAEEIAPTAGIGPGVEEGPSFPAVAEATGSPVDPSEVRGLTGMLSTASGSMRDLALSGAADLGPAAIPELTAFAADQSAPMDARAAALEVLLALDDVRAEITLLELLRTLPNAGLRAHAAWRLSEGQFDCVVPGLLLRLKYEEDMQVLRWIATALAKHGNYAGVEDLLRRAEDNPDDPRSADARATADALAVTLELGDGLALRAAWRSGDPQNRLPDPERTPAFDLAAWRWIERLEDYQLRGVDDARFVFGRLDAPSAVLLGRALHDENVYVRTHVAQCLERMGPRALAQTTALTEALSDHRIGPVAAGALGAIGALEVEPRLLALTSDGVRIGLRLAALRALTAFGPRASQATGDRFRELFAAPPSAELWQAAGEGLLARDAGASTARAMADCVIGQTPLGPVEPRTTSDALRAWLSRRGEMGNEDAIQALEAWDAATIESPYFVPPKADIEAMREQRRQLAAAITGE
jgi:HEAT repeat protein